MPDYFDVRSADYVPIPVINKNNLFNGATSYLDNYQANSLIEQGKSMSNNLKGISSGSSKSGLSSLLMGLISNASIGVLQDIGGLLNNGYSDTEKAIYGDSSQDPIARVIGDLNGSNIRKATDALNSDNYFSSANNFNDLAKEWSGVKINSAMNPDDSKKTWWRAGLDGLSAAGQGALHGLKYGGLWGAVGGAAAGLGANITSQALTGQRRDAYNSAVSVNTAQKYNERDNNYNNLKRNQGLNAMLQYTNSAAYGGQLYDFNDFNNGLMYIGNGGTHEANPYGGIFIGMGANGNPNMVEEGEIIYDNYVFSNRLQVPKELLNKYKLGRKLTFADAVKKMQKESSNRPNDSISKRGLNAIIEDFRNSQEQIKARQEALENLMTMIDNPELMNQQGMSPQEEMMSQSPYEQEVENPYMQEQMMTQQAPNMFGKGGDTSSSAKTESTKSENQIRQDFLQKAFEEIYDELVTKRKMDPKDSAVIAQALAIQAAHESNFGRSTIAKTKNNFFGWKAFDNDISRASAYNSFDEGLRAQVANLLDSKRYSNGVKAAKDVESIFRELATKGYASDPDYAAKLTKLNKKYASVFGDIEPAIITATSTQASPSTNPVSTNPVSTNPKYVNAYGLHFQHPFLHWYPSTFYDGVFPVDGPMPLSPLLINAEDQTPYYGYKKPEVKSESHSTNYSPTSTSSVEDVSPTQTEETTSSSATNKATVTNTPPASDTPPASTTTPPASDTPPASTTTPPASTPAVDSATGTSTPATKATTTGSYTPSILANAVEEATKRKEAEKYSKEYLRDAKYRKAPVLGSAIQMALDALGITNTSDYKYIDEAYNASKNPKTVSPQLTYDYINYTPLDTNFYANRAESQIAANRRALQNQALTRGAAINTLLSNDYVGEKTLGDIYRMAEDYNTQNRMRVADYNKNTNQFNASQRMSAANANMALNELKYRAAYDRANAKTAIDNLVAQNKAANWTNFWDNLGNYGTDAQNRYDAFITSPYLGVNYGDFAQQLNPDSKKARR